MLAYRRLGFGLREIADLIDDPDTDAVGRLHRLHGLLRTSAAPDQRSSGPLRTAPDTRTSARRSADRALRQ
jgi:hypothetical protein